MRFFLILICLLCGCGTKTVVPHELIGTWQATKESIKRAKINTDLTPVLEIKSDNTFNGFDLPNFLEKDESFDCFKTVKGTWAIEKNNQIEFTFRETINSRLSICIISLEFVRYGKKLYMQTFLGDPDQYEIFEYEKK